jgi:hypothetical protein
MIRLQPYVIAALARHYGLRRSALSSALFEEIQDAAYAAQIGAWYESLPADGRLGRDQLATLTAPDLLADVRILHGLEKLTRFWLLARLDGNGPVCLLAAPQQDGELEIKPATGPGEVSDTILMMLASAGEPSEPEMRAGLSHAELAALLGWIDLDARAAFVARIAHEPRPESFAAEDLAGYCARESSIPDPRWLLPLLAPLLDKAAIPARAPQAAAALQGLARRGLAEPRGAGWGWTLPGQFLSETFQRRTVLVSIDTAAAAAGGALGRHAACLLRADHPMWLLDIPPQGEATLAGASILDARQVLDTLFTPLAQAPEWPLRQQPPAPAYAPPPPAYAAAPPPAPAPPPFPASAAQPPAVPPAPGYSPEPRPAAPATAQPAITYCRQCRQALPAGAVFCGFCGTRQS